MASSRLRWAGVILLAALARGAAGQERPTTRPDRPPAPAPSGVKVHRDLEYARPGGPGEPGLLLDIYVAEKADTPLPLIIWVHGGAWAAGSKDRCPAARMATRGYTVASINYRLSQRAKFPAQIEDCKAAVRWLRANASNYRIDPNRVGAWGASAGGHLVALLGTSGEVKELEGNLGHPEQSSRVQAVCDFFGPTDFVAMTEHFLKLDSTRFKDETSPLSLLIGGPVLTNKAKAVRANPIAYVTGDDPPFLVMHGDRDNLVPLSQSTLLVEALRKARVEATLHVVNGAGHGFGGPDIDRMVSEFFDRHLKHRAATSRPADPAPGPSQNLPARR